jgi:hypothetical protein
MERARALLAFAHVIAAEPSDRRVKCKDCELLDETSSVCGVDLVLRVRSDEEITRARRCALFMPSLASIFPDEVDP